MTGEAALEAQKDRLRRRFTKHHRRAFRALPTLDRPHILHVGCGSGVPTMELARLSHGDILGIDIDQPSLDRFTRNIEAAGLSGRVKALSLSMFDMDFPDGSFDIIWTEGAMAVIGFERGLKEWRRFLRPNGFLVVHDQTGNMAEKLEQVRRCGYNLLKHFAVPEDEWWTEFYAPLEKCIAELGPRCAEDREALAALNRDRRFIEVFKQDPGKYGSVFFVMKKAAAKRSMRGGL
jgi:SAM-dependent methyltransferase